MEKLIPTPKKLEILPVEPVIDSRSQAVLVHDSSLKPANTTRKFLSNDFQVTCAALPTTHIAQPRGKQSIALTWTEVHIKRGKKTYLLSSNCLYSVFLNWQLNVTKINELSQCKCFSKNTKIL